jgi:transposase
MTKKRREFSKEFKQEAVALVVEQGYSLAEAGRSLGVRENLIGRWKRQLEVEQGDAFPGRGKLTPEQQRIRELEEENRRLRMEKDILKKATLYSTDRRNTFLQFICRGLIPQYFPRPLVKPSRRFV